MYINVNFYITTKDKCSFLEKKHCVSSHHHTWPVAHNRQLFIPVCVHCDKILGVGVQHQPPAGKFMNNLWTAICCIVDLIYILLFLYKKNRNGEKEVWDALPASLGSNGNHSSWRVKAGRLSSVLSKAGRNGNEQLLLSVHFGQLKHHLHLCRFSF